MYWTPTRLSLRPAGTPLTFKAPSRTRGPCSLSRKMDVVSIEIEHVSVSALETLKAQGSSWYRTRPLYGPFRTRVSRSPSTRSMGSHIVL